MSVNNPPSSIGNTAGYIFNNSSISSQDLASFTTLDNTKDSSNSTANQSAIAELKNSSDQVSQQLGTALSSGTYNSATMHNMITGLDHDSNITPATSDASDALSAINAALGYAQDQSDADDTDDSNLHNALQQIAKILGIKT